MTDYRIRSTGEVTSNLYASFPNVSIPIPPTQEDLDSLGVDPILEGPQPTTTPYQYVVRSGPTEIKGQWYWVYTAYDMDAEQKEYVTQQQWNAVIATRDSLLQQSDYTQLPDVPLSPVEKQEWATYRQQLRDITNQPDPFNIIWPVPPVTPFIPE